MASELRKKIRDTNNCKQSCTYTSIETRKDNEIDKFNGQNVLLLVFKEKVKKIESFYLYSWLSLLAEIGGYVGLFLGISVVQITKLINLSFDGIKRIWK